DDIVVPFPAFAFLAFDQRCSFFGEEKGVVGDSDVLGAKGAAGGADAGVELEVGAFAVYGFVSDDFAALGLEIALEFRVGNAGGNAKDAIGQVAKVVVGNDVVLADDADPARSFLVVAEEYVLVHDAAVAMAEG